MPFIPSPSVIERSGRSERITDIFSRLLSDRIIMLSTQIDFDVSAMIVSQLLYLESENPDLPISLYIHSPGGIADAALSIYDTMQYIKAKVHTICFGSSASAATILIMAGEKGKRYILPHANMMIHQPLGGTRGQFSDIQIQYNQMSKVYDTIIQLYKKHTKMKNENEIKSAIDRDNYLSAHQSIDIGLVDNILTK